MLTPPLFLALVRLVEPKWRAQVLRALSGAFRLRQIGFERAPKRLESMQFRGVVKPLLLLPYDYR